MSAIASDSFEFIEGNSAKFYDLELVEEPDGFAVKVTFGRIGAANPQSLYKIRNVTQDQAQKMFERCVAERLAKGYVRR